MISRGWLDGWVAAVDRDAENAHIGRFADVTVRLVDDRGGDVVFHYDHGQVHVSKIRGHCSTISSFAGRTQLPWRPAAFRVVHRRATKHAPGRRDHHYSSERHY